ncbi:MAG: hypothetical protein E7310_04995 [Clostridiales bacterium]|nr:hypothetical protein [Clostridiales bacterium]
MSITEDYDEIRKRIGARKYKGIEDYIDTFGKKDKWKKETVKLRNIEDVNEWEKKYIQLCKECKPLFIEDVFLNEDEWKKFEDWYEERIHTFIIELWENNADRENGFGQILPERYKDIKEAIQKAKEIFETTECVSIEVLTEDREKTYYFRDKVNEKYYNIEEVSEEKEDELDEP